MTLEIFWSYLLTLGISALLVPFVSRTGKALGIVAQVNRRTIHHGIIARTGGIAIYLSFMIGAAIFLKADRQINAILAGGFLIFSVGFFDDIYDLSPKKKLLVEFIATAIIVFYGDIALRGFDIPFFPKMHFDYLSLIVTFGWVIGITNAINLIDGLDGLCAGVSVIVLVVIAFTSVYFKRTDIAAISILLAGSICGFLCYNFHPASIFMGDCGALFIGFMISAISLLGFGYKSSAFFTLGAPIVMLAIPIMDTCIAIVRRRLKKKKFSEADREHLHHTLMFKLDLGQTRSVIILYMTTILFAMSAYLYIYDKQIGMSIFIALIFAFEILVEYTEMVSIHYKPILSIINLFLKTNKLPFFSNQKQKIIMREQERERQMQIFSGDDELEKEKERLKMKNRKNKNLIVGISIVLATCVICVGGYFFMKNKQPVEPKDPGVVESVGYLESKNETDLMKQIYTELMAAVEAKDEEAIQKNVARYFAADFFTWDNKEDRENVGGLYYVLPDFRIDFGKYATNYYYVNFDEHALDYGKDGLPEVTAVTVSEVADSEFVYLKTGNEDSYDVYVTLTYEDKPNGMPTEDLMNEFVVTLLKDEGYYYVVGVDYQQITPTAEEAE